MENREILFPTVVLDGGGGEDAVPSYTGMEEYGRRNAEIRENTGFGQFISELNLRLKSEHAAVIFQPWSPLFPDHPNVVVDPVMANYFQVMVRVVATSEYVDMEAFVFSDTYEPLMWTTVESINDVVLFVWGARPQSDLLSTTRLRYGDAEATALGYILPVLEEVVYAANAQDFDAQPEADLPEDAGNVRQDFDEQAIEQVFVRAQIHDVNYQDL